MIERDDLVYIQDIIESIEIIEHHIGETSLYDFDQNILIQDAIIRRFEVIGEAASHISEKFKSKHDNIEWRLMSDMRNKLIHEYFGVSINTIYNTIKQDLPALKMKMQALLSN